MVLHHQPQNSIDAYAQAEPPLWTAKFSKPLHSMHLCYTMTQTGAGQADKPQNGIKQLMLQAHLSHTESIEFSSEIVIVPLTH